VANVALIAIETMIAIMLSEHSEPVYEVLKTLILEESRDADYARLTLEKLWTLVDHQQF
jgi:hypothetical protein